MDANFKSKSTLLRSIAAVSLLLSVFLCISIVNGQSPSIDSLLIALDTQKGEDKVNTCYQLVQNLRNSPDSVIVYINRGLNLSGEINYAKGLLKGYNELAVYWYDRGQTDSSIAATKNALKLLTDKPTIESVQTFSNYGLALRQKARYVESAEWYLKSLSDAETVKDSASMVKSLHNLGVIYRFLGDSNTSLNYYNKGLRISEKIHLDSYVAKTLGNIALLKQSEGKLDEAEAAFEKSIKTFRKLDDKQGAAITLMDIGRLNQQLENFDQARKLYEESIALSREIQDHIGVIYTAQNLASLESQLKNYNRALQLVDTALAESEKLNFKQGIKDAYNSYSVLHAEMGNYKKAFDNRILYESWKDTVANESYLKAIKELETKYETEKKQNEILSLSEENLLKETTIAKKNSWIQTLSIGGISLAILGASLFVFFRQKSRLSQQNAVFAAMAQTEIREQHRIARDLHDSIGVMLAAVKNQLSGLHPENKKEQEQLKKSQQLLNRTADETRRIAHNMMPEELTKFGLINALESLLESIASEKKIETDFVHYGLEERLNPIKELHIYRIVQELFQNIQRHAKAKYGSLQLTKHPDELNLLVEDDGVGFETNNDSNEGLGLKNIISRVNFLKGTMKIDSSKGTGTSININIPMA